MKKSELKQLIREIVEEVGSNPVPNPAASDSVANKFSGKTIKSIESKWDEFAPIAIHFTDGSTLYFEIENDYDMVWITALNDSTKLSRPV